VDKTVISNAAQNFDAAGIKRSKSDHSIWIVDRVSHSTHTGALTKLIVYFVSTSGILRINIIAT